MPADYVLTWPDAPTIPGVPNPTPAEVSRRRRHAPGLWAQRLVPGIPPDMPPDFSGAFSTCRGCPFACCEKCPPNDAWTEFHAREVEATNPAPRPGWWQRITGQSPEEINT